MRENTLDDDEDTDAADFVIVRRGGRRCLMDGDGQLRPID
jgi:hypothetical protein